MLRAEPVREPAARQIGNLIKSPRLFKQVRRTGHQLEYDVAVHLRKRASIESKDLEIGAAHDEQRRRLHERERRAGEIRTPAPAHDRINSLGPACSRDERRRRTSAGAEQTERQAGRERLTRKPVNGPDEASGEQLNIKTEKASAFVVGLFAGRKEIQQQRREAADLQGLSDKSVPRTEAAAAAAVREHYDAGGPFRHHQISNEIDIAGANVNNLLQDHN
jgi:hypothetical protein